MGRAPPAGREAGWEGLAEGLGLPLGLGLGLAAAGAASSSSPSSPSSSSGAPKPRLKMMKVVLFPCGVFRVFGQSVFFNKIAG